MSALPRVFAEGKTPEQWVAELKSKGVAISTRTLREKARRLGACCQLGRAVILLPEHIDAIFQEPDKWQSKNTSEEASTGGADDLLTLATTTEEALEHLTRISQTPKSGRWKGKPGNVLSLDPTRRR